MLWAVPGSARPEIHGRVEPGFERVREAFAENFDGVEVGASFAVRRGERALVDLWGGFSDAARTRPWRRDTLANVWSTTKGISALVCALLVDRRALDYDAPVARLWPEFGARGRQRVTLAMLLSHQAGLSGPREPVTWLDFCDADAMNARLLAQDPLFEPGSASGYHAVTFGPLVGELVRRAAGRSLGRFLADEIAGPLGADFFIGLPEREEPRCAEAIGFPAGESAPRFSNEAQRCALGNPRPDPLIPNQRAWRAAEIPSVNGRASADGIARIYAALAAGGALGGVRLLSRATLSRATACQISGVDLVLPVPLEWGCGWIRNSLKVIYGPNPEAFGHTGWGGSFGYADPQAGIGVGYAMNRMGESILGDPRGIRLVRALHDCL
jgi:CubicO group peptidase (beta-lactamase class C family)